MPAAPLIVESELGQYEIGPDKIKMIRFLKPAENLDVRPATLPPDMRGNVRVADARGAAWLIHGKVTTTSDKEIVGDIHIPVNFALELEFGTLTPSPEKLRTLTLIEEKAGDGPRAAPDDAARENATARPKPAGPQPAPKAEAPKPGGP